MESISRPRSFAKMAATAGITLLAAGFITALGIGLEGMLWQVNNARAEMDKAKAMMEQAKAMMEQSHALMEQARAAMEQARATVAAAESQAHGVTQAANATASAVIQAAAVNAKAVVAAAREGNAGEVARTEAARPAFFEPAKRHAELTQQAAILNNEIETRLDYESQRPLSDSQIDSKKLELASIQRKIGVIQAGFQENVTGVLTTLFKAGKSSWQAIVPPRPVVEPMLMGR
jgi:hypothetical protein